MVSEALRVQTVCTSNSPRSLNAFYAEGTVLGALQMLSHFNPVRWLLSFPFCR